MKDFNKRGFGAGGLPPSFFSHLSRNWSGGVGDSILAGGVASVLADEMEEGVDMYYGPGVGLMDLPQDHGEPGVSVPADVSGPSTSEQAFLEEGEEGQGEGLRKVRRVMVPSSQVKPRQGGRGRERRKKKASKLVQLQ